MLFDSQDVIFAVDDDIVQRLHLDPALERSDIDYIKSDNGEDGLSKFPNLRTNSLSAKYPAKMLGFCCAL